MRILQIVLLTLIALLGITFACLNAEPIPLHYYVGVKNLPLSLLLILTLILGCFLGAGAMFIRYLKQKTSNLHLQYRLKSAEKELATLRALPLKENH